MGDRGGMLAPGSLADDSPREVDAHGLDEADREDVGPDERHGDDVGALRERAVDLAAGDGVVGAEEAADAGEDVLEVGLGREVEGQQPFPVRRSSLSAEL